MSDRRKSFPPNPEDLRRLIAVADPDFQIVMKFAAASGLRAGELHALRWRHLDLEAPSVTVQTRVDSKNREDAPKSAAGFRTVPLAADVAKMMREWRLRSRFSKDADLVFPNQSGGYVRHTHLLNDRFNPLWSRLAKNHAKDPVNHPTPSKKFNWHALRHFAVSSWIAQGAMPKAVQTWAGHSTMAMTMDTYGHLFPSDDHATIMDAASKALFS